MKILTNKQYMDLLLKSTSGMFGAVTDDMLLRNNAFINEENRELKARIGKAIDHLTKIQERYLSDFNYSIDDEDLDEIMIILKGDSNE